MSPVSDVQAGSASLDAPDYWWYSARAELLEAALGPYVGSAARGLDLGSADAPSATWLRERLDFHVAVDIDPRGLRPGDVCGSALELPLADEVFDVVTAFDVIEHCEPEDVALGEVHRVLRPGGRFLMSVPSYQWAWSDFDVASGHHRRYTRTRAVAALEKAGFEVDRATYAFAAVFPAFAAQRLLGKGARRRKVILTESVALPEVSPLQHRVLTSLCRLDSAVLRRAHDLPFGSSVLVAATRRG